MFDYNSMMALKELVAGEQQPQLVQNAYKGSALNPGDIGTEGGKKELAKPYAKMQTKIGQKYIPKQKQKNQMKMEENSVPPSQKIEDKHKIWDQEEVAELPISKQDPRKMPEFDTLYRQKIGTEDVYLGLSGTDPSSNHCHQITYRIKLPGVQMKQIQLDLSQKQMVVQSKEFYLMQHFQYPTDPKKAKAKFVSDKEVLELIIPIKREQQ